MLCKPLPGFSRTVPPSLLASNKAIHGATGAQTQATNANLVDQDLEEKEEETLDKAEDKRRQNDIALVAQLKVCATRRDLCTGARLHAAILDEGLLKRNIFIGNTLIDMYAKCGALIIAQKVFDELSVRNVVSWNALMAGYVQHKDCEKAADCFKRMQGEAVSYDMVTFSCMLKACCGVGALEKGKQIHAEIIMAGLLMHSTMLGNSLLDMYAKCGVLTMAQEVFDALPAHDLVSWNALIAGYCQQNHYQKALSCFEQMKHAGLSPDAVTFSCIIRACGNTGAAEKVEAIHAEIIAKGLLENHIRLGSALIDMYAKWGALAKAQQLLDALAVRDVISWTVLIVGYCQHGHAEEALKCFELMKNEGLCPDSVTFACILKACSSIQEIDRGRKIHADIVGNGFVGNDTELGNSLVDMYAKCGVLAKAQHIFDELYTKDVVSWTILISEYCQHGHEWGALHCFRSMKCQGLRPDALILAGILKACGSTGAVEIGKEVHADITGQGLLYNDCVLGSTLVDMYAKCGVLDKAQRVFDELPARNVVTWNALLTGYCQHNCYGEVLDCFKKMKDEGVVPDGVTLGCILKACGRIGAADMGEDVHAEILVNGFLKKSTMLGSALVDMYAKCGSLSKAEDTFCELLNRDVIAWTGLIAGYCKHGLGEEALDCFEQMKHDGHSPDAVTFACVLKACGSIGAVDKGYEVHAEIARMELLQEANSYELGSALVDMYAKCGALRKAQQAFDELCVRDVVAWSALIIGYSEHGHDQEAVYCFEQMIQEDCLSPDAVIFACVLKAYVSLGNSEEGFANLSTTFRSGQISKHMAHMFTHTGSFDKRVALIKQLQTSDQLFGWIALLEAYREFGKQGSSCEVCL